MRAVVLCLAAGASATPPVTGPFDVTGPATYTVDTMDSNGLYVYYPTTPGKYPLLMYAHGASPVPGSLTMAGYKTLFQRIASFGFVLAAPDQKSPKGGWDDWCAQNMLGVDFVKSVVAEGKEAWAGSVDLGVGIGVVGHSMGGQSVGDCVVEPYVSKYNIKAGMMHHPFAGGWEPKDITVPIALFTGTTDSTCSAASNKKYYDQITSKPRTWRNQVGINHLEPNEKMAGVGKDYNPQLGYFTAAWFKVYIGGDKGEYYQAFYNATDPDSLCQYAEMESCENIQ